jgi:hypothetical protein
MYKRNIEVRSRNHCSRGKAIGITYSARVCSLSYSACEAHAPYYVICGLSGTTICFSKLSHKRYNFREKVTEYKTCVLIFSTNFI